MFGIQILSIGKKIVNSAQLIQNGKSCFALVPYLQVLQGHVLITTKRSVLNFSDLTQQQLTQTSLMIQRISRALEIHYQCSATTLFIQNQSSVFDQTIIHLVPRKLKDLVNNDQIYDMLEQFPSKIAQFQTEQDIKQRISIQAAELTNTINKYQNIPNL